MAKSTPAYIREGAEIIKAIQSLSGSHSTWEVFQDFLAVSAISISNWVDWGPQKEREEEYLQTIKKYKPEEQKKLASIFGTLTDELQHISKTKGPYDVLGGVFHGLELHNKYRGQFFTPFHICQMMGEMTVGDGTDAAIQEQGYVSLCEPCVGSGGMVLGFAKAMEKRKLNYQQQLCVCTACGKKIKFSEPVKHRSIIKCPKCGKQTVVFEKRYTDSIRERRRVCIADRKDGHLLFRWLDVSCGWYIADNGKYKPYYNKADYARTLHIYEQGKEKTVCYEYKYAYPWGAKWRKQGLSCDDLAYFYNRNLTMVFGNKYYNVDLEKELQKNHQPLHVIKMLKHLKELPPTEYLFKMGMYRLASELDPETLGDGRNFASILGVSAQYKKMYAERNISNDEHCIIKAAREWVSDEDFVKLRNLRPNSDQSATICMMLETMTFKKFVNYFTVQRKLYPREALDQVLRWYNDYISMSEQMNVDLSHKSVRYPKDIKIAHNELLKKYKVIENEVLEQQMKKATENLYNGLTEYKDKDYAIVFPHSRAEFIAEGQSLNHCVGTQEMYFKNHLAGTKMIFFVRRAADIQKPYVTMEIDMKRLVIMQIYGYGDKRPDVQTIKFANKFLNLLKKDVTARRAC